MSNIKTGFILFINFSVLLVRICILKGSIVYEIKIWFIGNIVIVCTKYTKICSWIQVFFILYEVFMFVPIYHYCKGVCWKNIFFVIPSKVRRAKSRNIQLIWDFSPPKADPPSEDTTSLPPRFLRGEETSVEMTRRCCATPTKVGMTNKTLKDNY